MKNKLKQHIVPGQRSERSFYFLRGEREEEGLLFLNGLYHSHTAWLHQQRCPALQHVSQLFVDYRGVGDSKPLDEGEFSFDDVVDDIAAACTVVGFRRLKAVIGFSLGGMVALRFAERYPELVGKLVVLNSGLRVRMQIQSMVASAVQMLADGVGLRPLLQMLYPWNHSESYLEKVRSVESEILDAYCRYNANMNGFIRLLSALGRKPDLADSCRAIEVPTLIIGSEGDEVFPFEMQRELASHIAHSRLEMLDGCGHSSFVERHALVNQHLVNFLDSEDA